MKSSLTGIARSFSAKARARRAGWFRDSFSIDGSTRILDLGSETGENIHAVLDGTDYAAENVYIADIDAAAVEKGAAKFGFVPVVIDELSSLPFEDGFFDIVYCSSVIEHVTVPKDDVWTLRSGAEFNAVAEAAQRAFAAEIVRVGRGYFVQTPARGFPVESHSWLPFAGQLPRPLLVSALKLTNAFWIKKTIPDFRLFGKSEFAELFPGARVLCERSSGLTKSYVAVKRPDSEREFEKR